ncbi:MAG: hypothetical protein AAF639_21705, partial [Chloroflexota bacterium]
MIKNVMYLCALFLVAACVPTQPLPTQPLPTQQAENIPTTDADALQHPIAIPENAVIGGYIYETMTMIDGTTLEYALFLPIDFDPSQVYPIMVAMPPGGQNKSMVDAGFDSFWAEGANTNGWIVVSPVAPNGTLFFNGSEAHMPDFLDHIRVQYAPEGGKFHLTGISNGGISTFRVATIIPDYFHSILVVPGFPRTDTDFDNLSRLVDIPIAMYVGEDDSGWVERMEKTAERLTQLGGQATLVIKEGEGHLIGSLTDGVELYEVLESFREDVKCNLEVAKIGAKNLSTNVRNWYKIYDPQNK